MRSRATFSNEFAYGAFSTVTPQLVLDLHLIRYPPHITLYIDVHLQMSDFEDDDVQVLGESS